MKNSDSSHFSWIPIGGLGEVGMNCMVMQFGKTNIAIDAGILFADENDFGIDSVHPGFEHILKEIPIKNWIITHGHEDHIGAVAAVIKAALKINVMPPTFWAPPFAAALIQEKLNDFENNPGLKNYTTHIKSFTVDETFEVEGVKILPVSVRHSTPQSCSLYFKWTNPDSKKLHVFHTSDFKIDENEYEDGVKATSRLEFIGNEELDFLLIDSTNSERPGRSSSELELIPNLEKIISETPGRIYITLFSSNVYRISSILKIADKCGRYSCLAGRSLQNAYKIARQVGLLQHEVPDTTDSLLLDAGEIGFRPPHKQLIICSGSQGEFRSVLRKMSQQTHPDFQLSSDDTVLFSSKLIPGNEKSVSQLINGLLQSGARVLWGDEAKTAGGGPIHASGHARRDEIAEVIATLKPKHVIPVHGELRQLRACQDIALEVGAEWKLNRENTYVTQNGTHLQFEADISGWKLLTRNAYAPLPKTLKLEYFSASSQDIFLKQRKRLALGGAVSINFSPTGKTSIQSAGLIAADQLNGGLSDLIQQEVENFLFNKFKQHIKQHKLHRLSVSEVEESSTEISRILRRLCGFKPYVFLHIGSESV